METVTAEARPVIDIPETGAQNEIIRYEPPAVHNEASTTALVQPDSDVVDTTWRVVDDKPVASKQGTSLQASTTFRISDEGQQGAVRHTPTQLEPKPYTLNQQLTDEWQANGWMFERPASELSVGEQLAQRTKAPAQVKAIRATALAPQIAPHQALSAPASGAMSTTRQYSGLEAPSFLLAPLAAGFAGLGLLFDRLFDLFTFGLFAGRAAPRYIPAKRVLFVTRLDFGETLGAYLVGEGLPLQVEGMEDRKANMPEYKFSISAGHLRWGLSLMRDYGCDVQYDDERELWEVLPC